MLIGPRSLVATTPFLGLPGVAGFNLTSEERQVIAYALTALAKAFDREVENLIQNASAAGLAVFGVSTATHASMLKELADRIQCAEYVLVGPRRGGFVNLAPGGAAEDQRRGSRRDRTLTQFSRR